MRYIESRTGIPCLYESGGNNGNTGRCQLIAGSDGEKKKALFIVRGNVNGDHAVVPICSGDIIAIGIRDALRVKITFYRIIQLRSEDKTISTQVLYSCSEKTVKDVDNSASSFIDLHKTALYKLQYVNCDRVLYAYDPKHSQTI